MKHYVSLRLFEDLHVINDVIVRHYDVKNTYAWRNDEVTSFHMSHITFLWRHFLSHFLSHFLTFLKDKYSSCEPSTICWPSTFIRLDSLPLYLLRDRPVKTFWSVHFYQPGFSILHFHANGRLLWPSTVHFSSKDRPLSVVQDRFFLKWLSPLNRF